MFKKQKFLTTLASTGAAIIPVVTVISCGSTSLKFANKFEAISTGSYAQSMIKLVNDDITLVGAFGDARNFARENADKLHVVGVEKKRITNDGIQARGDLNANDQKALQNLFKSLITLATAQKKAAGNTSWDQISNKSLLMQDDAGKVRTIFEIYSHSDYKVVDNDTEIGILLGDQLKEIPAMGGSVHPATTFDSGAAEFFSDATLPTAIDQATDLTNNFTTKDNKLLRIQFIPSNDPAQVQQATSILNNFLKSINVNANINVSSDYDSAASQLSAGQLELAFLPAGTWAEGASDTNFILRAARPLQIATLNVSGATATLPGTTIDSEINARNLFNKYGQLYLRDVKAHIADAATPDSLEDQQLAHFFDAATNDVNSFESKILAFANGATDDQLLTDAYEAWIYSKIDSPIDEAIGQVNGDEEWTLSSDDVYDKIKYGYTSTTSSASYLFPEIWMSEHFN